MGWGARGGGPADFAADTGGAGRHTQQMPLIDHLLASGLVRRAIWTFWYPFLTRRLRADERTAQLPIVMISADDGSLREAAREAGVSLLLGKPYPEDELIAFLASTRETAAEA